MWAELAGALTRMEPLALLIFLSIMTNFFVVYLLATGRLVPRRGILDTIQDRNHWRETAEKREDTNRVLADQVGDLLEVAKATEQLIRSLPSAARETRRR